MKLHMFRLTILFLMGGNIYMLIEMAWRGCSHWSMGILGGLCFVLIGLINEVFPWRLKLYYQMALAAMIVTMAELLAGLVLNIWLGLNIWDYSQMPLNLWGQICLPYAGLWFILSLPAIIADDYIRWSYFKEERPRYMI